MDYITIIGSTGSYGECRTEEWQDMSRREIAVIQHNNDGTFTVTLVNAKHVRFSRTLRDLTIARNVCEAHIKARGFTKLHGEYADVRAYND